MLFRALALLVMVLLFACDSERPTSGDVALPERSRVGPALQPNQPLASGQFGRRPCADEPRIGRVGFPGTPPVLISRVEPSMASVASGVRGIVILETIIDSHGVPCSVAVVRSLGTDADAAAVNAVKQWRFVPAKLNGETWSVAYNVTVRFGE